METFADRLTARTRELEHPLCVGLDPYVDRIPAFFRSGSDAETTRNFLTAYLDIVAGRVAIVKPQISLFERMGIPGLEVLQDLVGRARALGLLVLLDAKRGDIGATARGYAEAYLGPGGVVDVDAVTVNPYMGLDSVEPFVEIAESRGKGVVVLVRNSNPGSDAFQKLDVGGRQLFEVVAESLAAFETRLMGTNGWSSLGVTVSALSPDDSRLVRQRLPKSLFLVLGYGEQGGTASDATAGLKRSNAVLEGGVVSSSRSLLYPELASDDSRASWQKRVESALSAAVLRLQAAAREPAQRS